MLLPEGRVCTEPSGRPWWRSKDGIEFQSLDGQPVKLVVLFLAPLSQRTAHLSTLAGIARTLNPKMRTALDSAMDAAAMLELLKAAG